jgi:hypothetical protein
MPYLVKNICKFYAINNTEISFKSPGFIHIDRKAHLRTFIIFYAIPGLFNYFFFSASLIPCFFQSFFKLLEPKVDFFICDNQWGREPNY